MFCSGLMMLIEGGLREVRLEPGVDADGNFVGVSRANPVAASDFLGVYRFRRFLGCSWCLSPSFSLLWGEEYLLEGGVFNSVSDGDMSTLFCAGETFSSPFLPSLLPKASAYEKETNHF